MSFTTRINWEQELETIKELGSQHKTLREIGEYYGVSKQRIKQICQKYKINSSKFGKGALRQERLDQYKKKWGDKADSDLYREQRSKFRTKKANAIRQGIEWNIDFGDIDWPVYCPMLGIKLNYFPEQRTDTSCSFDRLDPTKGYVKGNVIIISWRANRIKNDATSEELFKIASYLKNLGY